MKKFILTIINGIASVLVLVVDMAAEKDFENKIKEFPERPWMLDSIENVLALQAYQNKNEERLIKLGNATLLNIVASDMNSLEAIGFLNFMKYVLEKEGDAILDQIRDKLKS